LEIPELRKVSEEVLPKRQSLEGLEIECRLTISDKKRYG
jgi:hypothetical protein